MGEPNEAPSEQAAWKSDQAPCVYCGQVIPRSSDRCAHCRTSFSLAVRKASREVLGPWYYLDPRNPSGRGITFETLIKMIEKGRIRADSVVRGPTTHQDWMFAGEAPRLAKYLGMCPHCFAEAKPEDTYCTSCQLNMNQRPAEPRPGVPADLVKDPVHRDAYEMEKQLAAEATVSSESLAGEPLAAPPPRLKPAPARSEPTPSPSPTAVAAAAALADSAAGAPAASERQSRIIATGRRQRPKVWVILMLTWATLMPIIILVGYTRAPLWMTSSPSVIANINGLRSILPFAPTLPVPEEIQPAPAPADTWLTEQLAAADKAEQAHDYAAAIRIYQGIVDRKPHASYQERIEDLRRKAEEERQARLVKLRERLELSEQLAQNHQYADALAVLRNIGQEDRAWLSTMGFGVDKMEASIQAAQRQYAQQQKQEAQLVAAMAAANALRGEKKPAEALLAYKKIGMTYPADMIAEHLDLMATLKELETEIAAGPPTPPEPVPPEPAPPGPKPPTPPPAEAAKAVADLMERAVTLEKAEKFAEALQALEEIKATFDKQFWPDVLEDRIREVKAKKEALEFFGIGGAPKKP